MKTLLYGLATAIALLSTVALSSCDDNETYADLVKHERNTIGSFIARGATVLEPTTGDTLLHVPPIKVISEDEFAQQDSTTDVNRNEYVLISASGIYMQIVRKGTGTKLANGESATVLCRFLEYNIGSDSIQARNDNFYFVAVPDVMNVTNSYGTFTGSLSSGVMRSLYNASPPEGWLAPLAYINLGRQTSETDRIAKVRLIVPHTSGQTNAQASVYACYYDITYERGR